MYQAIFDGKGNLDIHAPNGDLLVSGDIDAEPGTLRYHPMMAYAIALMKHHGDWPDDPFKAQTINLVDGIH